MGLKTMRIAYFDCSSGVSGDMILASLLDAGLDFEYLKKELGKLKLAGYKLSKRKITKSGFTASKFDVIFPKTRSRLKERPLGEIKNIINKSGLSSKVKTLALKIFENIADAECAVHNIPKNRIHFHEIGSTDSLVDIVGFAIAFEHLNIDKVYASSINLGSGVVKTEHGLLPVPAPVTSVLLKGVPIYSGEDRFELTTPTGAGILKTVADSFGFMPLMSVETIGTAAGTFEAIQQPNILRVFLGQSAKELDYDTDSVIVIQTNIDDMNMVGTEHMMEEIFAAGALDVYFAPVYMKKSRMGILLSAITKKENLKKVIDVVFQETTTLGVRVFEAGRYKLPRFFKKINTEYGSMNIKIGKSGNKIITSSPEYRDARLLARKNNVALRRIYEVARQK